MELLRTPRPQLVNDVPAAERTSREDLLWIAHSYFDALEGDSGRIAAFADDCVPHENGYQTVANKTMLINMTTMETFGIRGGKIHEVEVFPFVVLPYGYGTAGRLAPAGDLVRSVRL
jgi:hypothetical protein